MPTESVACHVFLGECEVAVDLRVAVELRKAAVDTELEVDAVEADALPLEPLQDLPRHALLRCDVECKLEIGV